MTISVDYWSIDIDDTISSIGATTILEQCGLLVHLCDQITVLQLAALAGYVRFCELIPRSQTLVPIPGKVSIWPSTGRPTPGWYLDYQPDWYLYDVQGNHPVAGMLKSQPMIVWVLSAHAASHHRNGAIRHRSPMIPMSGGLLPSDGVL